MLALSWASVGSAAVRRFAVVVGNNRGDSSELELRWAETDARRTYDVLKVFGGFAPADIVLLRGENAGRLETTLLRLNERIRSATASGDEALLFVYYSGHADADALHLKTSRMRLARLEQLVRDSSATFRVLTIDACRSGISPLDLPADKSRGLVVLTAASAREDAQESDALGASFFTYHFVAALRGAADTNADGRVTLEEAYRYTHEATVRSTRGSWAGVQHPTLRSDVSEAGKLTLTELPPEPRARGHADVSRIAHGPEAAYTFRTVLGGPAGLCHGGLAGWAVHTEAVSFGARLAACRASVTTEPSRIVSNELGVELRAVHTWDLHAAGIDLGIVLGAGARTAESRPTTPVGSFGFTLGPRLGLGAGFSVYAESALLAYIEWVERTGMTAVGPTFTYRQAFGVSKAW